MEIHFWDMLNTHRDHESILFYNFNQMVFWRSSVSLTLLPANMFTLKRGGGVLSFGDETKNFFSAWWIDISAHRQCSCYKHKVFICSPALCVISSVCIVGTHGDNKFTLKLVERYQLYDLKSIYHRCVIKERPRGRNVSLNLYPF